MSYSRAWDETRPAGNIVAANTLDTEIQYVRTDVSERMVDLFTMANFTADPIVAVALKLNRTTVSKILGGTTSLSWRNAADNADNLIITDAGAATFRNTVNATTFVGALTGNASGSSGSTTGNAATATALQTARTIGGTSFDGTANIAVALAATATALAAARNINGVAFDGTANITIDAGISIGKAVAMAIIFG